MNTLSGLEAIARSAEMAEAYSDIGEQNRVVFAELNDTPMSVKVPRCEVRNNFWREAFVMAITQESEDAPVTMPRMISLEETQPPYLAYHYLPGKHLSVKEVQQLSASEHQALGRKVVDFVIWLAEAVPLDEYPELAEPLRNPSFGRYRLGLVQQRAAERRRNSAVLWPGFEEATDRVLYDVPGILSIEPERNLLGHGDIRSDNMLFSHKSGRIALQSIIDFGIAEPSYHEYELRHIPLIGPEVASSATTYYRERTGKALDEDLMLAWAQVQLLAACAYRVNNNMPLPPDRLVSLAYLFPDIDFAEGIPLSEQGCHSVQ